MTGPNETLEGGHRHRGRAEEDDLHPAGSATQSPPLMRFLIRRLTSSRFSDDAPLTHPLRQQCLSQRVVDFVRARVRQVFTLQIDLRATQFFR